MTDVATTENRVSAAGFDISAAGITPPSNPNRRGVFLADVIVELGLADKATIDQAMKAAQETEKSLERYLLEAGILDEASLSLAIAERNGLDLVDLEQFEVDMDAAQMVARSAAQRYGAVPVAFASDGALIVAVEDPFDTLGISDIEVMTRSSVRPAIATHTGIEALLERLPEQAVERPSTEEPSTEETAVDEPIFEEAPIDPVPDPTLNGHDYEMPSGIEFEAPGAETASEVEPVVEIGTEIEPVVEAEPHFEPVVEPEPQFEPVVEVEAEIEPGPEEPEPQAEPVIEAEPPLEILPEDEVEAEPEHEHELVQFPDPEPVEPDLELIQFPEPEPEPEPEHEPAARAGGVPDLEGELSSLQETARRADELASSVERRIAELKSAGERSERLEADLLAAERRVEQLEGQVSGVDTLAEELRATTAKLEEVNRVLEGSVR